LAERPQLRLEVRGSSNPKLDAAAIREAKFVAIAEERSRRDPGKYPPTLGGAGFAPRLFRDLYTEQFGKEALQTLEQKCQVPKKDKGGKPHPKDTVLDEGTFYAQIRAELTAVQPVDAAELRALAQDRFTTIKNVLVRSGSVEEQRIFLLEIDENGATSDSLVRVDMKLTG